MRKNVDLIVEMLKSAGINEGFGIPSGNVIPLIEAMRTGGMQFILTAHEGSAGFAADVMGRMTGRPGFCIATHGPGATNLTTGVGCAYLDRSPMIAITCNVPVEQHGHRVQMHISHHDLFKPITKATLPLRKGSIAQTVAKAIQIALSEPMGPVHLDLPEDVELAEATEQAIPIPAPTKLPKASADSVAAAAKMIAGKKKAIAVIGTNAMRMKNPDLLREFIDKYQIPFATTTMAKGLIDENHPLSLGCIERSCRQHQRKLLRSADLIVGLGYDTIEVEYEAWIGSAPLLHVDIEKVDAPPSVKVEHQVIGDLDDSIAALTKAGNASSWDKKAVAQHRTEFQAMLRPATNGFTPHQAIDTVRQCLPKDGVLTFDVGAHTHQIGSQWTAHAPRTFQVTNGWSSMGFGIPAAIAAKLADPSKPVVCILGDGCFQMTCGEVAVAKRYNLSIPIVVLDDRWLALIRVKQERKSVPYYGTDLQEEAYQTPPAHYFGVPAVGVSNPSELSAALTKALKAKGPTVIEAIVDASHYSQTVYD